MDELGDVRRRIDRLERIVDGDHETVIRLADRLPLMHEENRARFEDISRTATLAMQASEQTAVLVRDIKRSVVDIESGEAERELNRQKRIDRRDIFIKWLLTLALTSPLLTLVLEHMFFRR